MLKDEILAVSEIAAQLGISRQSFYKYFRGPALRAEATTMPIRKHRRWLYPIDGPKLSQWVRFDRAKGRCEQCGRPYGKIVAHLRDARWWDEEAAVGRRRGVA